MFRSNYDEPSLLVIADYSQKEIGPHLPRMAQACLNSAYFLYDGKFYEQSDRAGMGFPLSLIANHSVHHGDGEEVIFILRCEN